MSHFVSTCFCFVLLLSLAAAAAVAVIVGTADTTTTTTTATGVQCTAGSHCDRRRHCVKRNPSDNFGYCELFLRSGSECKQLFYTTSKPEGMVTSVQCAPGLMCQQMFRRDYPELMECTSLTK